MGKNDFLTPKAIANRIKAKGLQKLRWYCQLCQKQCRDENGFKCHQMSEGHRRQMEVFGQQPGRVIEGYSEEFEASFLDHLRRAHPASRVAAKVVYNEFIADRHHVHMNSTKWLTLSEFVKYLGRTGKCKVEETEKGWFITLIREDPNKVLSEAERLKRERMEEEEEERAQRLLMEQVGRAQKLARRDDAQQQQADPSASELKRSEADEPIKLSLAAAAAARAVGAAAAAATAAPDRQAARGAVAAAAAAGAPPLFGDDDDDDAGPSNGTHHQQQQQPRKLSKVEELMQRDLQAKQRQAAAAAAAAAKPAGNGSSGGGKGRLDHWLHEGIVVKVLSKALKEAGYYKQKGVVDRVIDKYVGEVVMSDSGDVIRVDQAELETVLPAPGGTVLVVNGHHRGLRGRLVDIDVGRFQAQVELQQGSMAGHKAWLDYEDVCKLAAP